MADKDVEGVLDAFEPVMHTVVCTQNSTPRSMRAESLAEIARGIFGADRVEVAPRLDDAIDRAVAIAESSGDPSISVGGGGVLITGSVITAGEARVLLGGSA
jgi:dihydrofolate synthase/folylpolyglutamate synthase